MKGIFGTKTITLDRGKKVYLGMSGGVDSSVSALLLQKAGYDVTGVFIKVWQPDWPGMEKICTWREDRRDAMRVAAQLNIPFITLDLEKEYKEHVVDYMISEYKAGRTPNPDVMCNQYVKFGGFFDWAFKQGADYVATGHYAQVEKNGELYQLVSGEDVNKDQSYFLWTLTQKHLSKTLFPVGSIEKKKVREYAEKYGLATALKKDSQGLCFIGKIDIKEFLSHYISPQRGIVRNEKGEVIGHHDCALFFTIGERHGFTITEKTPHDTAYYVVSKDIQKNELVVSHKTNQGALAHTAREVVLKDVCWNQTTRPHGSQLTARSRYREKLQPITVTENDHVIFTHDQSTLTVGQSVVVYNGNICCGGGIISEVIQYVS